MLSIKEKIKEFYQPLLQRRNAVNYRGKGIINLIDVGSIGDLPSPWKENAYRIHHLLKFEPRDAASTDPYVDTIDTALWEKNCERDFYIYRGFSGSGSSLFAQNFEYVRSNFQILKYRGPENLANTWFERSRLERVERITCRTLDDILSELGNPYKYHFIKIDAQGAEYQILKGAEQFLSESCLGLHLELFVIPLYKDITLLPEVVEYLNAFDFKLVKKFPAHGSFDSQHDCLFLKRGIEGREGKIISDIYKV